MHCSRLLMTVCTTVLTLIAANAARIVRRIEGDTMLHAGGLRAGAVRAAIEAPGDSRL